MWRQKLNGWKNEEIGAVDYYSEGFGHEGKWMVENNTWDAGSRVEYFLLIISTLIQILSHAEYRKRPLEQK